MQALLGIFNLHLQRYINVISWFVISFDNFILVLFWSLARRWNFTTWIASIIVGGTFWGDFIRQKTGCILSLQRMFIYTSKSNFLLTVLQIQLGWPELFIYYWSVYSNFAHNVFHEFVVFIVTSKLPRHHFGQWWAAHWYEFREIRTRHFLQNVFIQQRNDRLNSKGANHFTSITSQLGRNEIPHSIIR